MNIGAKNELRGGGWRGSNRKLPSRLAGRRRSAVKHVLIGVALLLLLGQASSSLAHSGDILSAWAVITPTIDGTLSAGEWVDADTADFTLAYCSESHDVTLHVKNDANYLYLAAVVRNEEYSDLSEMYHDFANFYFDNNNNGATDVGEDGLAIRFDNTIFEDTFNPNGVNGWSYSDTSDGGSNDINGAVTHTNPVPDGVGDYTFEYRHPLNSTDNAHDFSLAIGDTVGFRFSFPDGETTCQPVGYHWPSSNPASYGDIVIASEAYLSLLFVPLNWTDTQAQFEADIDTQIDFFLNAIPLHDCPEEVSLSILDVDTQNYATFACGTASVRNFVTGLGINPADFDIIVGLTDTSPCPPIAGQSNGSNTIWVETTYESVTAHELGHIYDLEDEYCSNPAGSTDCRCNDGDDGGCGDTGNDAAATGDVNFLDDEHTTLDCDCPADGTDDSTGDPCCDFTYAGNDYECATVDYGICCLGNKNTSGGRAIMSFADVDVISAGTRDYDEHSIAHFATLPDLQCHPAVLRLSSSLIELLLSIKPDFSVVEEYILLSYGRPTRHFRWEGDFDLVVYGKGEKVFWQQSLGVPFDYNGPVYLGMDYSDVKAESFSLSYSIPYEPGMENLVLLHKGEQIFSKELNFCNQDGKCGTTETYHTCPEDCPLEGKDKICIDRAEGVCDPDCLEGVDPDCKGDCGNHVCNVGEDFNNCPEDCTSGGGDGYCDREKDDRCDPDCAEGVDPDCVSACGDGECFTCENESDALACENALTCVQDCPTGGKDFICDQASDGICDPDCANGEDPDCAAGVAWWIWLLLLLVLVIVVVVLYSRRRIRLRRKTGP
jgi:hypothetical protein